MFRTVLFSFVIVVINGCVTAPANDVERLQRIEESIASLEMSVNGQFESACALQTEELKGKLKAAEKATRDAKRKTKVAKKACKVNVKKSDKLILGALEAVKFSDEDITLNARVDTGAETSSLGIYSLVEFERDGKGWVRFKLKDSKSAPTYEYPVSGRATIKQRDQNASDDRLEIKMDIWLGGSKHVKQTFNLADRSYLDYQVLLGRSFLTDIAVVDTARKYNMKKGK